MTIYYTKRRLKIQLILALGYLILSSAALIFDSFNFFNIGFLVLGLISLGTYLFENHKQYLTIANGVLIKNTFSPKSIKLDEINQIKKFAGDYILKTEQNELRINISYIEKDSLFELEKVLNSLGLNKNESFHAQANLS